MANDRNFGYNISTGIKNFQCLRCLSYWAGGLGVAQALVLITITIIAILSFNCIMPVDHNLSIGSLMDTLFFDMYFRGNCNPDGFTDFNHTMLDLVNPVLDSSQMLVWVCVYLGVSVCWLLASVVLLTDLEKDKIQKSLVVMYSWSGFTFCISAMDLALGIMFAIDFANYQSKAYGFNLNSSLRGAIDENSSLLVGAMVVTVSLMIVSLKGFVLWFINVGFTAYFFTKAIQISTDKDGNDTLFMPTRKESDDILTTRAPIQAYGTQNRDVAYSNDAFVSDSKSIDTGLELNLEPLNFAAQVAPNIQEMRFRNVDAFQQYPPPKQQPRPSTYGNNVNNNNMAAAAAFPDPDYSPPMSNNRRTLY